MIAMIAKKKLSVAFLPLVATASVLSGCELAYKKQVAAFVNKTYKNATESLRS